jgi:hypothetical protein
MDKTLLERFEEMVRRPVPNETLDLPSLDTPVTADARRSANGDRSSNGERAPWPT